MLRYESEPTRIDGITRLDPKAAERETKPSIPSRFLLNSIDDYMAVLSDKTLKRACCDVRQSPIRGGSLDQLADCFEALTRVMPDQVLDLFPSPEVLVLPRLKATQISCQELF